MNQKTSWSALFAALGLAAITGCASYEPPPKAVTHSSFTGVPQDEQKRLTVSNHRLLTLEDAQSLAVRNNPNFKTKYFAIVAARAAYYGAFAPHITEHLRRISRRSHWAIRSGRVSANRTMFIRTISATDRGHSNRLRPPRPPG